MCGVGPAGIFGCVDRVMSHQSPAYRRQDFAVVFMHSMPLACTSPETIAEHPRDFRCIGNFLPKFQVEFLST